jgi:hypothetical protein
VVCDCSFLCSESCPSICLKTTIAISNWRILNVVFLVSDHIVATNRLGQIFSLLFIYAPCVACPVVFDFLVCTVERSDMCDCKWQFF